MEKLLLATTKTILGIQVNSILNKIERGVLPLFFILFALYKKIIMEKEEFIQNLQSRVEGWLKDSLVTTMTTCRDAPCFGWSLEEYLYMPEVANRLRKKGMTVTSSVNFGVTDWKIAK